MGRFRTMYWIRSISIVGATIIGIFTGALLIGIVMSVILAFPVKVLWNYVMPDVFGLPTITYQQALGLCILLRLLIPTASASGNSSD